MNRQMIQASVKRSLHGIKISKKVLQISYEYLADISALNFNSIVTNELCDEELETLRVAQTEVLADFPDGTLLRFRIYQYTSSADGNLREIPGNIVYTHHTRNEKVEVKNYKLLAEEECCLE